MIRLLVALMTALYAIAFAFMAIMAVRWPSVLAVATLISDGASAPTDVNAMLNWRQLGLFYGGLYFFAALCFYTCSTLVQRKARGALTAFILGLVAGFPFLTLFDFAPGWWETPNLFEKIVLGALGLSFGLIPLIRMLGPKKPAPTQPEHPPANQHQTAPAIAPASAPAPQPPRRRKPVPAAIARQRECFAEHGRRSLARRAR